jgi:hypothetical protein
MEGGMLNQKKRTTLQLVLMAIAVSMLILATSGCDENPDPVSIGDRTAEIFTDTLFATFDTSFVQVQENLTTLNTSRLLIGRYDGVTCKPMFKFLKLPDSISTVDSAYIEIKTGKHIGDFSALPFIAKAYPISVEWLADTSGVWESSAFEDNLDLSMPIGEFQVSPIDSQTLRLNLNGAGLNLIQSWADTSSGVDNNGLALTFDNANFMKELLARDLDGNTGPTLYLHYTDSIPKIDTLLVSLDVYHIDGTPSRPTNRLITSTLKNSFVTLFKFDFDELWNRYPQGVLVENARLELSIDRSQSYFNSAFLGMLPLADSSGFTADDLVISSDYTSILGSEIQFTEFNDDSTKLSNTPGSEERELAANYVQVLLVDSSRFAGFYMRDLGIVTTFRKFVFYRTGEADIDKRPKLILKLLRVPAERF